ncbi:hypothetical protein AJ80_04647 [Polytolypa hystricis UAMH7299]|uniref:Peptidase A1 domain-containing protein n=1 Tax=Polytolypa hystricis (strain UAMH7299) TaxID=1447883 RepID=A0A2B7Y179_POLH7|nr:hypothetical protein AJ80_04647 [Polytolypa hystricis UAMH7299]
MSIRCCSPPHIGTAQKCLILVSALIPLVSADCAPPPIPINIENVTLPNNEISRGLGMSVGNPPQKFSFLPAWPLNNTYVFGSNGYCTGSWSDSACTTLRGGQYDKVGSTTRGSADSDAYPTDGSLYKLEIITDNLTITDNVTFPDFALGISLADWGLEGYHPRASLGLGPNSSVLHALQSARRIASRSWSMFWGQTGATENTQLDGSFIFGGYDRAKVSGNEYSYDLSPLSEDCATGMVVTITDISLEYPNGTSASLFSDIKSAALATCLIPDLPWLMTLPYNPYFVNFQSLTNASDFDRSFGINYYTMVYNQNAQIYDGDMTIKLSSGLSVRISNDQLVVPRLLIDRDSGELVTNSTETSLLINSLQGGNSDDLPQLGRNFLSSAYLMVNQDANKFTLWAANPTINEDIVAVDSNNKVIEEFCDPTTRGSTPSPSAQPASSSERKLSRAAIAGIAVGSVAGVGTTAGIVFMYMKRQKVKAYIKSQITSPVEPKAPPAYGTLELHGTSIPDRPPEPQELP